MEEIFQFLLESNAKEATLKNVVLPQLHCIGFRNLADLVDMELKDLEIEGIQFFMCVCACVYECKTLHDKKSPATILTLNITLSYV